MTAIEILAREYDKLLAAARFSMATLPEDYHDAIIDENSLSHDEFHRIVGRNNKLCVELGLQYLWSCMVVNGEIVFTSARNHTGLNASDGATSASFSRCECPAVSATMRDRCA